MSHTGRLLLGLLLAAGLARADEASELSSEDYEHIIARLREDHAREIADLREESRDRLSALEHEVLRLGGRPAAGGPDVAAPPSASDAPPTLSLRGFGHMQGDWDRSAPRTGASHDSTTHFTNGGVDLFLTSQISDRLSFLNETVFEFGEDGANILDVERVMLKLDLRDSLSAAVGRGHTALGYWNQHFHHGTWLQTTTERPIIYRFEDDGGILPVHFVGLELSGTLDLAQGSLSYIANLANGRGNIADSVQLVEDRNDSKMVSFMASYEPAEGMGLGFSVLRDEIPGDATLGVERARTIDEMIFGPHLWYSQDPIELIAETLFVKHDDHTSRTDFTHNGGYVQLAYRLGEVTPYYRYDFLNMESGDPFFFDYAGGVQVGPLEEVEDTVMHTLGLRYEFATYLALKAELRSASAKSQRDTAGTIQASFAF
jgi:hypothetical protein